MEINSIGISKVSVGGFDSPVHPEINVVKSLPTLSVVQSVKGSYRVWLENSAQVETGERGVFIAPANLTQHISDLPGDDGTMISHWIFFEVEINKKHKLDEIYSFPLLMPPRYNDEVCSIIENARAASDLPSKMPFLVRMVNILLEIGTPVATKNELTFKLKNYLDENYTGTVSPAALCGIMCCSRSAMYSRFKELMGETPVKYVNNLRISRSQDMLLETDLSVAEISAAVGFRDQLYFARLFKNITGTSASEYRRLRKKITSTP